MNSKSAQVKSLFNITEKYLGPRQFDIRVRVETIQQFTNAQRFGRVLDIGCGNGAISLPLLPRTDHLTLLDLSPKMLDLARQQVPAERSGEVALIEGNFLEADLEPQSFDLILCIGVLAHVDSVEAVIAKVARLAKPGASVLLEFTDSYHFWGLQVVLYRKLLKLWRPEPYALNRLKEQQVVEICRQNGLSVSSLYRYGVPPVGFSKFADQDQMYRMVRYMFGPSGHNRNSWMGNQFLCRLQMS
jgi:2-polyprenyl-3-methyl-5-hydroxy-6-metoxy-1,4-benzoquinol methylase